MRPIDGLRTNAFSTYSDMDPLDAKRVSAGDADPVTLLAMEDINPGYVPRVPLKSTFLAVSTKGKGKAMPSEKSASEGILNFFGAY